jgi:mono/diheme cytochrome c family protein
MRAGLTIALSSLLLAAATAPAVAQDAKLIEQGAKVYADQKCSMCHSVAGKGNAKGALDEVGSKLSEEDIRQWLINPRAMEQKTKATRKPVMPPYAKLSADDLNAVVAYMKSLKKK